MTKKWVNEQIDFGLSGHIDDLINSLTKLKSQYPGCTINLEINDLGYDPHEEVAIISRLETDEEYEARLESERIVAERKVAEMKAKNEVRRKSFEKEIKQKELELQQLNNQLRKLDGK